MSATFFGERDLLPSVDQYWSDEDDELELPTPEPQVQIVLKNEFESVNPLRVFVSFVSASELRNSSKSNLIGLKAIGSIEGDHLNGHIFQCDSDIDQSIWILSDDLHLLARRAQVQQIVTCLSEKLQAKFSNARFCLLTFQNTFDESLQCFSSSNQLHESLQPFQLQPPLTLCRTAEAALFSWRVEKKLQIDYFRLPRLADQLPDKLIHNEQFLPKGLSTNLWSDGGNQYLKANNNLYA